MYFLTASTEELFLEYFRYLQEQKANGKKLIGYLAHEFIPEEIIYSMNCIPISFIFAGDEERTAIGAGRLNPTMCPFSLSLIGTVDSMIQSPSFRFLTLLDGFIVSNYCTTALLTAETITEQLHLKRFDFHIPFLQTPAHIQFYSSEIEKLIQNLAEFSGSPISLEKLMNYSKKLQKMRKFFSDVNESNLSASEKLKIFQWSLLFGPESSISSSMEEDFQKYKLKFEENPHNILKAKSTSLIFAGNAVFIGDDLLEFLDDSGVLIIWNDTWLGSRLFYSNLNLINTPNFTCQSLQDYYNYYGSLFGAEKTSLHCSPDSLSSYLDHLISLTNNKKANGIIYHLLKFCDIMGHHRQEIKERLSKQGIPVLILERDYSKSISGQIRTRIEAFLEMLQGSSNKNSTGGFSP